MKLILHIGTEKTGSTQLQNWLYENEAALSQRGIALTHTLGVSNNRALAACLAKGVDRFLNQRGVESKADREIFFARLLREFDEELDALAQRHHTALISSEHFHSSLVSEAAVMKLASLLRNRFDDVQVVCFFREQSKLRTSLYSTALKTGKTMTLAEFHRNIGPSTHYYNYDMFFLNGRLRSGFHLSCRGSTVETSGKSFWTPSN